ncbi:Unknown protein [Striga hermonthica]|uniref:Uncharacterized protein n=1 Tax=Striga hermonthica TaxID=68872 RepID=A0A9N7MQL3_STRHE|nr:Unknown protein [Striga hermonthica]
MDQKGERREQRLPPDYVSLAQLRERWLQKRREEEMRDKQKEVEMIEKNEYQKSKRNWPEKVADGRRRRETNGGRERGWAVVDKGKGDEMPMGGSETKTYQRKNKKKNRYGRMEKSEKESEVEQEKLQIDTNSDVSGGIKEVLSGKNRGNTTEFRGGLTRNGENWENGVGFDQLKEGAEVELSTKKKMVEKKDYSRNRGERRSNRNYRSMKNDADVSEGNVVEKESMDSTRDKNLEVYSATGRLNGDHRVEDEGLNGDQKAEEFVLDVENLKIEGELGNGYNRRYWNQKGNHGRKFRGSFDSNDRNRKAGDVRRYGRFEGHRAMTEREMIGKMWVRKEVRLAADDGAHRVVLFGTPEDQE